MGFGRCQIVLALCSVSTVLMSNAARAQGTTPPSEAGASAGQHEHMQMNMPEKNAWQFMQDGIVFANFNHQGGPRGGSEFVVPNWWMGMASRDFSRGRLTFTGMLSLDPATVGKDGSWRGFEGGIGADVSVYGVPSALRPMYSSHPVSFHVFFRLKPPAGAMGRMWNMRMAQPMAGQNMGMTHQMP